jgi:hypothetical protein
MKYCDWLGSSYRHPRIREYGRPEQRGISFKNTKIEERKTYGFLEPGNDVTLNGFVALVPKWARVDEILENVGSGTVVEKRDRGLLLGVILNRFDPRRAWKRLVIEQIKVYRQGIRALREGSWVNEPKRQNVTHHKIFYRKERFFQKSCDLMGVHVGDEK